MVDYCFVLILQLILILQDPLQLEKREGLKDEGDLMFKLECIQQQQDIENNRLVHIMIPENPEIWWLSIAVSLSVISDFCKQSGAYKGGLDPRPPTRAAPDGGHPYKKYLKISLLPLIKKVIKKALINTAFSESISMI